MLKFEYEPHRKNRTAQRGHQGLNQEKRPYDSSKQSPKEALSATRRPLGDQTNSHRLTTFQLAETKVDFPLSTQTIFYEEEDLDFSEESIWLEAEVKLDDDSDFNCISESDSDNSQYEFISTFLHAISERPIPVNTAASISGLQKWMEDILEVVSRPSSPAAKRLFKTSPSMVLFANQLHLVHRCGPEIEIVAQKASSRDYYYDFLTRNFGHERAQDWLTGRGELDGNKRKAALPCSGLLKRVLVNQALKAFNALDSSDDCSDY